ncbi:hypothetical protein N431DRAFT_52754 [Stipitochalara longipes BDJ]|nr:hypothetical protein N431DRAFT_52754 [Stipitochalara longipes BDJ]
MAMATRSNVEELFRRLEEQHQAYLRTLREAHEALAQPTPNSSSTPGTAGGSSTKSAKKRRRSTQDTKIERPADWIAKVDRPKDADGRPVTLGSSVITGESEESDIEEEFYVQKPLPSYTFDHEDLKKHLKTYTFNKHGEELLATVVDNGKLLDPIHPKLIREYPLDELWHDSHYSVFDVGTDGAPLSRSEVVEKGSSIDSAIWQAIQVRRGIILNVLYEAKYRQNLNSDPESQQPAVGRITIVREPSPIILGALHLTMNQDFEMDELFELLVTEGTTHAYALNRNFSHEKRIQRSFVFKFDYFTIVGEGLQPMPWQQSDTAERLQNRPHDHIPISRCCSVVALSLSGDPVKRLRNNTRKARKEHTDHGNVYDPWAPWHVLNIQCYPDHKHSLEVHDSTKHYVNGPEAFMNTLLAEFQDAENRFSDLYKKISKLVIPPADLMFDGELRDKLLFEDKYFTYSRRYFWGYQTLGVIRDGIKAIIDSYKKTFKEEVWEGKHRTLFPRLDETSSRNVHWKERMLKLKEKFEKIIKELDSLYDEIDEGRKEIRTLRDQLFSGTSVLESRKSVELSEVTILQGHNIKLLTLVSIFFLPLTFVTSVFGMSNIPPEHFFKWFGITMATVCIPFFLLIGSLNTNSGMEFWRGKWHQLLDWIIFWRSTHTDDTSMKSEEHPSTRRRSLSASEPSRGRRASDFKGRHDSSASMTTLRTGRLNSSAGNALPQRESGIELVQVSEGESANSTRAKTTAQTLERATSAESVTVSKSSWFDKLTGGRKKSAEHNV